MFVNKVLTNLSDSFISKCTKKLTERKTHNTNICSLLCRISDTLISCPLLCVDIAISLDICTTTFVLIRVILLVKFLKTVITLQFVSNFLKNSKGRPSCMKNIFGLQFKQVIKLFWPEDIRHRIRMSHFEFHHNRRQRNFVLVRRAL